MRLQKGILKEMEDKKKTLSKMARLARLKLTLEEEDLFTQELSSILDYFQKINPFVEKDLLVMVHPLGEDGGFPLRKDVVEVGMKTHEALKNTSEKKDSFFKVPPVRKPLSE